MFAVDYSDAACDARIAEAKLRKTGSWQAYDGMPRVVQPLPWPAQPLPLNFRKLSREKAPEREWVHDKWTPRYGTVNLGGPGGIGKSVFEQHAATLSACGKTYFAPCKKPVRAMIMNCEDDHDELWRRQEAICAHEGIDMGCRELEENLILQSRYGHDNALMTESTRGKLEATPLFEWLRSYVNDLKVEVLWLDNAAHMLLGNHDDRTVVTAFINMLNGLVTGRPFTTIIVTHPGRAQGSEYSGSVAWENAVRMRWYLGAKLPDQRDSDDEEPATNVRYLCKRKSNYSAKDYVRFEMRGGLLVPDETPSHVKSVMTAVDFQLAEETVLAGFRELQKMGIRPSDGSTSPDYLPKQLLAKRLGGHFQRRDLDGAMNRLMTRGVLSRGVIGQYSNRNPRYGLVLNDGA